MSGIVILTGAPGTGKTTLASRLAGVSARGVHVPADVFFTFPAHPISPYRPAAWQQNADIIHLSRVRQRGGSSRDHVVRLMHGHFDDLGPYAAHTVDAATLSIEELASQFNARRAAGAFVLDLEHVLDRGDK